MDHRDPADRDTQPLRAWQAQQLAGIRWLQEYDRRARARTWVLVAVVGTGAYAGAATAAYAVLAR